jgi:hypothetical protein
LENLALRHQIGGRRGFADLIAHARRRAAPSGGAEVAVFRSTLGLARWRATSEVTR